MTREEGAYLGYEWLDVKPSVPVNFTPKYTYREACLLNGFDPDLPLVVVFDSKELA